MSRRLGKTRLWEVDAARGVAICLMVVYHTLWDLRFYELSTVDVGTGGWLVFARAIGTLFLFLVGVSMTLEGAGSSRRTCPNGRLWPRAMRRGLKIFGWALAITMITRLVIPHEYIRFGILHLIGIAVMTSPLIVPLGTRSALLGAVVVLVGLLFRGLSVSSTWGIPLGLTPDGVSMVDYYPVFPWLGVVMIGVAAGTWLYPQGERRYITPAYPPWSVAGLSTLGRHSLIIYLAHQPVLLGLLLIVRRVVL